MTQTSIPVAPAPPPLRRTLWPKWLLIGAAALVGVLILALFVVIAFSAVDSATGDGDHVVTGPRNGRTEATVELLSGATAVTV
ncbi:hypothetical protein, partial [Salmonella sp. SAL4358]|uniref:hypothetical protein n=1 Tax=Salmonella sp. SAL4358 TaxID=3159879 RepID=UPI00397C6DDF